MFDSPESSGTGLPFRAIVSSKIFVSQGSILTWCTIQDVGVAIELTTHVAVRDVSLHAQGPLMYAHIPALSGQDPGTLIESLIPETFPIQYVTSSVMAWYRIQNRIGFKCTIYGVTGIDHRMQADTMVLDELQDALVQSSTFGTSLMPTAAPAIYQYQSCPEHSTTYC